MQEQRRTPRLTIAVLFVVVYALAGTLGTAAVWTNTLGAADGFDFLVGKANGLMARVRLALDPPPDREIQDTVLVTPPPRDGGGKGIDLGEEEGVVGAEKPPKPERKPVDVKLRLNPARTFSSQHTSDWCAVAGTQTVLAILGFMDNSVQSQERLAGKTGQWESWRDSHNGGWGPAAIAQALKDNGVPGYQIRAYGSRQTAMRDAAVALATTKSPVVLLSWKGAHTWIMTGYRATADPTIFRNAKITGTYIYDPWYPRVSSIWGASDPPGTFQDEAEMVRNYLRWNRPEGDYVDRDGKFIAVVPTILQKDQPLIRR